MVIGVLAGGETLGFLARIEVGQWEARPGTGDFMDRLSGL